MVWFLATLPAESSRSLRNLPLQHLQETDPQASRPLAEVVETCLCSTSWGRKSFAWSLVAQERPWALVAHRPGRWQPSPWMGHCAPLAWFFQMK